MYDYYHNYWSFFLLKRHNYVIEVGLLFDPFISSLYGIKINFTIYSKKNLKLYYFFTFAPWKHWYIILYILLCYKLENIDLNDFKSKKWKRLMAYHALLDHQIHSILDHLIQLSSMFNYYINLSMFNYVICFNMSSTIRNH